MDAIPKFFRRLFADRSGATAVEYGLIVALIVVAMLSALSSLGGGANGMWGKIANDVTNATTQP